MDNSYKDLLNMEGGKEVIFLLEQYVGRPLNNKEMNFITAAIYTDGWSFDMLDELATNISKEGRFDFKRLMRLQLELADAGVKNTADIKAHFESATDKMETYKEIANMLGKKDIPMSEARYVSNWIIKYPRTLIIEAVTRAVERTDSHQILYADKILETWHNNNVSSIEDINAIDAKRNKGKEYTDKKRVYSQVQMVEHPNNPLYHKFADDEMKPCPFCGSNDILLQTQFSNRANAYYRMVTCNMCNAKTRSIKDDSVDNKESPEFWNTVVIDEVKTLWNTRV